MCPDVLADDRTPCGGRRPRPEGRRGRTGAAATILLLVSAALGPELPARADVRFLFEPLLDLALTRDENVRNLAGGEAVSDEVLSLRPRLQLSLEAAHQALRLAYQPEAEFFAENKELNAVNHLADLALEGSVSARTRWDLHASFLSTENLRQELLGEDLLFSRSRVQRTGAEASVGFLPGPTVSLTVSGDYAEVDYEDPALEGYEAFGGTGILDFPLGPRWSVGGQYGLRLFRYEARGDFLVHTLLLRSSLQATARSSVAATAGAFRQDYRQGGADDASGFAPAAETGFSGSLSWMLTGSRWDLLASGGRDIGASGGVGQSVIRTSLVLGLDLRLSRRLLWAISGAAWRNQPTLEEGEGSIEHLSASSRLQWRFSRHWLGEIFYTYIDQQAEGDQGLDLSFGRYGVTLRIDFTRQEP